MTAEVLEVIRDYVRMFGYPPTMREIATVCGMKSWNGARWHLDRLEAQGFITRTVGKARGIKLMESGRAKKSPAKS
jgi:repressor LexA